MADDFRAYAARANNAYDPPGLHPGDENDAEPAQPSVKRKSGRPKNDADHQKVLEYVQQHPGVTVHQARHELKNRAVLYELAKLGLVEKRGPQFFPKNAEARR